MNYKCSIGDLKLAKTSLYVGAGHFCSLHLWVPNEVRVCGGFAVTVEPWAVPRGCVRWAFTVLTRLALRDAFYTGKKRVVSLWVGQHHDPLDVL